MHGFGVHLGVGYQCWGREEGIMEFDCGCFQKMLGSRSCDLSVGMDDFLGNSEIQRRGPEQAQHQL